MGTRVFVSLNMPDVELDIDEVLPNWNSANPPTADDVIEAMKSSVNISRLCDEWGFNGPNVVHVQVVTDTGGRLAKHTYGTWDEKQEEARPALAKAM